jgi:hypothetical protein
VTVGEAHGGEDILDGVGRRGGRGRRGFGRRGGVLVVEAGAGRKPRAGAGARVGARVGG